MMSSIDNRPSNKPQLPAEKINSLVKDMVFGSDGKAKADEIRQIARTAGVFPASIQILYEAIGKGQYKGFTVPAINLRGISYDTARAVLRAAVKNKVGAFIFEIARSEMEYTLQGPEEFVACVLAAAAAEGFQGPVFIQADHTQIRRKTWDTEPDKELNAVKALIKSDIDAGFYNIDIDASTLVRNEKRDLLEQQEDNGRVTAEMTRYIRNIEPKGVTVSVGGEIGEIGTSNSTVEDLRAFMIKFRQYLGQGAKGISKISVQTGTTHGGIVLPDGSIAKVKLDFDALEKLSNLARVEYGMGGAVQHGASTLPDEMFDLFPKRGTLEVHLATGYQNIIFDSPHFPPDLLKKTQAAMDVKYASDKKASDTSAQFYYRNRKRVFGDFKKELWNLPEESLRKIMQELEDRFVFTFQKLNVVNTKDLVDRVTKA
jgi:fructose/tagatose bisphosphate aldolase